MGRGIYICYARKDVRIVSRIVEVLWNTVQNTIWFDQEAIIEAEEEYKRRIDESEFFAFIASKNAFKSVWCMQELLYANRRAKKIIIIYLEDCRPNLDSVVEKVVSETESIKYYLVSDEQMAEQFQKYVSKKGRELKLSSIPTEADLAYDIFISYRRGEATLETKIVYEHLTKEGYVVFLDKDEIHSGKWQEIIRNSIYNCKDFLLFLTPTALDSQNVRNEVKWALERKKHITLVFVTPDYKFPENLPEDIVSIQDYNAIKWLPDEINAKLFSLKNDFLISKPRVGMNQEIDEQRITQDKPEGQINTHELIERKLDDCEFDEVKELIGNPETNLQFRGAPDSEKGRMYKYLLWAERGMRWSDDPHNMLVEPFYGLNYNGACRYGYKEELESINWSILKNIHDFVEMKVDLNNKGPYMIDDPAQCGGDYRYLWECILFQTHNLTCFTIKEGYKGARYISLPNEIESRIKIIASFIDEFRSVCPKWIYKNGSEGLTQSKRFQEFIMRFDRYTKEKNHDYIEKRRRVRKSRIMSAAGLLETAIAIPLQIVVLLNGWKYFQLLPNKNTFSNVCKYAFVSVILLWSIYWDWKVLSHTGHYHIEYYKAPREKLDWRDFILDFILLPLVFLTKAWLGSIIGLICCLLPNKFRIHGIIDSIEKWWIIGGYLLFCILSAFFGMFPHGRSSPSTESQRFHEIEKSVTGWRRDIEPVKYISLL